MDMVHKDIDVLLGHLTSGGVDQELKSELMYMRTIFKFQHFVFSGYLGFLGDTITAKILEERLFYSPSCRTSKECMVNYVDSLVSFIIQKGRSSSFCPDTSMGDASKFLEPLLRNLQSIKKATRRCLSASTLVPSEILEEKLRVLVNLLHFKASTARQEYLLTRIQALAESAADLCFTFWVKMSDHFLDTDEISHLLYLRNICKERVPPLEINMASQMVLLDDQILDICKSQVTEDELTDEMQRLIKENREAKVTEVDLAEKFSKCVMDKKTRSKVTESDVAEKLHKFLKELKEKKYLIVLDDIWESRAYDEITRCFPTVKNGNRIMLTSRFDEVAHKIKLHSDPHNLPFFTKEESWELLQWKVFRNESCYPELLEIGKEISESCRGLPLFIVLVGGLLTSIKKEERLWSEVAKTLSSVASEHEILRLIYEHLPDRLKSCLLFFAAFPKDQEIAVSKLVQLWAAEGFIEKIEGKSLEDVARDYLSNLLRGGLITVSKRRYDGSIILCRVHNTIHEFCLEKAKKERFLMISSTNNQNPMWDMAYHRICFNHQDIECHNPLYSWMQWSPSVRTVLCTYRRELHFSKAIDFSQISRRSRLIRVLDLESITVGNTFFSVIEHLPHLRFIAVHTGYCNFVLPSSLGNLHNLETLKIKTENQSVVRLKTILDMVKLRQLDITDSFQFGIDEDDSCLKNLQALSTVVLPNKQSIGVMMIRFPFLRRLKCIYVGSNESSHDSNEFLNLEKLNQLESLHVSYDGPLERRDLIVFKFPGCLKNLILNGFSLPACEISKFALIPTLVALKLQNVHFKDHQWVVEECDFPQLNYLKLHNCSIVYWSALTSSFPCLKRLILRRCIILKEVPSCFGNIATLEAVEVYRCNSSLEDSVLKIQSEATNRSSPLMIRILKSDDLQIFYSLDAKKCSAGVSQLPENVVDKTKFLLPPPSGEFVELGLSCEEDGKKKIDYCSQSRPSSPSSTSSGKTSGPSSAPAAMTTGVFKVNLHCKRCLQKIKKIVSKTEGGVKTINLGILYDGYSVLTVSFVVNGITGLYSMKFNWQEDLLMVTGTMDMKAFAENLKKRIGRDVEIVLPKKEGREEVKGDNDKGKGSWKNEGAAGEKNEVEDLLMVTGTMDMKALAENLKKRIGRDIDFALQKKEGREEVKGGNDNGKGSWKNKGAAGEKNEVEAANLPVQVGYPYNHPHMYSGKHPYYQVPSDENPNACSVM
nr:putative late blight resistance protein homolog R1A-4 [Ipomoea trifida]